MNSFIDWQTLRTCTQSRTSDAYYANYMRVTSDYMYLRHIRCLYMYMYNRCGSRFDFEYKCQLLDL